MRRGWRHTYCFLSAAKHFVCRGNEKKPRRIAALKGVNIVQAACGGWHCLAVSNTGQAYAWGGNEYGQCGVAQGKRDVPEPTPCLSQHKVVQVAAGGMHTCALTDSGQVKAKSVLVIVSGKIYGLVRA